MLPLLTFFIIPSVSFSQYNSGGQIVTTVFTNVIRAQTTTSSTTSTTTTTPQITKSATIIAHVTVLPSVIGICFPQTIVVKEAFGNVTCFIELSNADVSSIDISSIRLDLLENPSAGIPIIPGSVTYVDDFNNNGAKDLFIQFDFAKFKNNFAGLNLPGNYHYQLSGTVSGFGFSQNSPVFAKSSVPQPSPSVNIIDYYTSFNGKGGNILVANNFRLSKYTAQKNLFTGFFEQRVSYPKENVISWGYPLFSSQGAEKIDFTVLPFLPPIYSYTISESLTVSSDGTISCSSTTNSIVICQGSGRIIMQGDGYFADNRNIPAKTLVYIITPTYAKIFGFDANNKMILEIENINMLTLNVAQHNSA